MINMRIGYVLLILSILLVCLWFTYVSVQSKEYYRRAFRMLMWAGVIMYVTHLYGISMEEGLLPYNQGMIIAERIIHYIMTVSVYSLYAYFMLCLLNQFCKLHLILRPATLQLHCLYRSCCILHRYTVPYLLWNGYRLPL